MNPAIEADGVRLRYGDRDVLRDLRLSIAPGTLVHLRGRNGTGKSTLLRLLAGLEVPDSGEVRLAGTPATHRKARALRSFTPDVPPLYDYLSVRETAIFAATMWGTDRAAAIDAVAAIGLGDALDTLVTALSLGMRKKLGLVVTTLHEPRIMLFDEPLNGLDTATVELLLERIARWREAGRTILLTNHDAGALAPLHPSIVTLEHGRLHSSA